MCFHLGSHSCSIELAGVWGLNVVQILEMGDMFCLLLVCVCVWLSLPPPSLSLLFAFSLLCSLSLFPSLSLTFFKDHRNIISLWEDARMCGQSEMYTKLCITFFLLSLSCS